MEWMLMKRLFLFSAMAVVLLVWSGSSAVANDVVIDRHFETQGAGPLTYWTAVPTGGANHGYMQNAVTGPSDWSWCYYCWPSNLPENVIIKQTVYLVGGVTYDFFANVASHEH
jgi:hypothetical protein